MLPQKQLSLSLLFINAERTFAPLYSATVSQQARLSEQEFSASLANDERLSSILKKLLFNIISPLNNLKKSAFFMFNQAVTSLDYIFMGYGFKAYPRVKAYSVVKCKQP